MNYYKQGDITHCSAFKNRFAELGFKTNGCEFADYDCLYFTTNGQVCSISASGPIANIIKTHPDYKELELPVEPKFKAEDRIISKSDKSTIYRIITLHEERREYIVEIEHKDYHESCPWIAFEEQDDYELVPKKHYAIANFHAGMPVLVREYDTCVWQWVLYSHFNGVGLFFAAGKTWRQCIPFNEKTKHLLGTTDMCPEEYINW